jgi:3-isopropylmalate/(R)-2-methylmalate dehydratase small subunit
MEPFQRFDAVAVPIDRQNIDTDQIIPARFLKKPRASNFGQFLFHDLRMRSDGSPNLEFVLNQPAYQGARIVVAARNFACGSSREHAVWALHDYGIRAAISSAFSDIFQSNAVRNGLLPVVLPESVVTRMIAALLASPGARVSVDLESQTVTDPAGEMHHFEINPFWRHCMLEGLDELAYTLSLEEHITAYEKRLT